MINIIQNYIDTVANKFGIESEFVQRIVYLLLILIIALIAGVVFRKILTPLLKRLVQHTSFKIDDYIFKDDIYKILSRLVPAFIISVLLPSCFDSNDTTSILYIVCTRGISTYIVFLIATFIGKLLTFTADYYKSTQPHNHYLDVVTQFAKLIIYFIAFIVIISVIINKNPATLIAGLGAAATILLLVFQDVILGFVAGIQLNVNRMLKVGDWIEIKDCNINGNVTAVTLTTVKIRNFDNSISTIPPYKLISEPFQNWSGIEKYGGRQARLKIFIDVNSIIFANASLIERLTTNGLLTNEDTKTEYNNITNITLYRKFIENFLRENPSVDTCRWLMVRQIQNTAKGIPLEMYFYIKETNFVKYENTVAEIYEYCIASSKHFELQIFQSLTSTTN
jgi:miniconductance mechanosensitive channel